MILNIHSPFSRRASGTASERTLGTFLIEIQRDYGINLKMLLKMNVEKMTVKIKKEKKAKLMSEQTTQSLRREAKAK